MKHTLLNFLKLGTLQIVIASSVVAPAYAIRDGQEDNGAGAEFENNVFYYYSQAKKELGTSFSFKYPRCLLTAAHANDKISPNRDGKIFKGWDFAAADSKYASIDTDKSRPNWVIGYSDLAVLFTHEFNINRYIKSADYSPLPVSEDLGVEKGVFKKSDTGKYSIHSKNGKSLKDTVIAGYGFKVANDKNADEGYRRKTTIKTNYLIVGHEQIEPLDGASYVSEPGGVRPVRQENCNGDSGGPLMTKTGNAYTVYGVQSSGTTDKDKTCGTQEGEIRSSALSKHAGMNKKSNWDWVNETADEICGKKGGGDVEKGKGRVSGVVSPPQSSTSQHPGLNGNVFMSTLLEDLGSPLNGDNIEILHYGQSLYLEATPDEGYDFVKWDGDTCPCDESTGPACEIDFDSIDTNDPPTFEGAFCRASFEPAIAIPTEPGIGVSVVSSHIETEIGSSVSFPVTITNSSSDSVELSGAYFAGLGATTLSIVSSTCPLTLPALSSCTTQVLFNPTRNGRWDFTSIVFVATYDGETSTVHRANVTLMAVVPELSVTPELLDFGMIAPGTSQSESIVVTNTSTDASAVISNVTVTGIEGVGDSISVSGGSCLSTSPLAPESSCSITVQASPSYSFPLSTAWLKIEQGEGNQELALPVSLGAIHPSVVSWDVPEVDLDTISSEEKIDFVATLQNGTDLPVDLSTPSITGTPTSSVQIVESSCGATLSPQSFCPVRLRIEPSPFESFISSTLSVTVNGVDAVDLPIFGAVVTPTPTPTPTPIPSYSSSPAATPTEEPTPQPTIAETIGYFEGEGSPTPTASATPSATPSPYA